MSSDKKSDIVEGVIEEESLSESGSHRFPKAVGPQPRVFLRGRGYVEMTGQWLGPDGAGPISQDHADISTVERVYGRPDAIRLWLKSGKSIVLFPDPESRSIVEATHFSSRPALPAEEARRLLAGSPVRALPAATSDRAEKPGRKKR